MNITELRYLVAIMKWGSVSAAAKQMYAAQPNVSKALKNLEEEYGIRMFERSSTGMIPTEQGRHFIEQQIPDTIQIVSRDTAGYVDQIQIGNAGFSGEEVQYALGLQSACFTMESYEDQIRAVSKGIGHGYGMSQESANEKAKAGWKAEDILSYFYKNITYISE